MLKIEFSKKNGSIVTFESPEKLFLSNNPERVPLFILRLIDNSGKYFYISSFDAAVFSLKTHDGITILEYSKIMGAPGLCVTATVKQSGENAAEWYLDIDNDSDFRVDYADYPVIVTKYDLLASGGDFCAFRPIAEGCVMSYADEDTDMDDRDALVNDFDSIYPGGWVTMQFCGYFSEKIGLYIAAHDTSGVPKMIKCFRDYGGLRFAIQSFLGIVSHKTFKMPYPIVTEKVGGGWMSLAERYREFTESKDFALPEKISQRKDLPEWYSRSPVVVVYAPTAVFGTYYQGPNEYYPYNNSLKYFDELSDELDSLIMPLAAYWEGSAPWSPPFLWPPYGSADEFCNFVSEMHRHGHLIGLYGSGTGWTDKNLKRDYDMTDFRNKHGLDEIMQTYPDGSLIPGMCDTIRTGFRMCPAAEKTHELLLTQCESILNSGIDYFQMFDQNLGGGATACYSDKHGHKPVYGVMLTRAMEKLQRDAAALAKSRTKKSLIGGEAAAADCFICNLPFNDLRYGQVSGNHRMVPAYEFVFHEYSVNFMGNQHDFNRRAPWQTNPDSYLFRLAYSFTAGDILTLIMKTGGELHWQWGLSWVVPGPRQDELKLFTRRLNAMRAGAGKKYLHFGKMLACGELQVSGNTYILYNNSGEVTDFPYVLHSKWRAPDGSTAYIMANFSKSERRIDLGCEQGYAFDSSGCKVESDYDDAKKTVFLTIPPLSAIGYEVSDAKK